MRRAWSWILACFILLMLIPAPPAKADQDIRVRVLLGTEGASKVEVIVKGTYSVGDTAFTGGTLTASINNGTITVTHSEKKILATSKTEIRVARADAEPDAANLTLTNKEHNAKLVYLGDLLFHNAEGTLEVINDVGLREYLYGAVSGELTNSSSKELLKAGTICAKGFALAEVNARKNKSFDVYDTTTSQLYFGYKASDTNVIQAVDEVWQNTLVYQGNVVKTYYCTANGGQVITPKIHWGGSTNDGAYYFGYDPFDIAANTKNVVLDLDGKDPSSMNRKAYQYFLSLAEETSKEGIEKIEQILAINGIYDPESPEGTDRYPADTAPHKTTAITMYVLNKNGESDTVTCSFNLSDLNAKAGLKASGTIFFSVRTGMQQWKLVYGISSGHRVGMSHRGAGQMAKEGYSYVDMLKFYYRGADLMDEKGTVIQSKADFSFVYEGPDAEAPAMPIETQKLPEPTETPELSDTAEPTETPESSDTAEPEETPEPSDITEPTETPEPSDAAEPEETPEPSDTPEPTETPEPSDTAESAEIPEPSDTPEPIETLEPSDTPEPMETPEPSDTPEPTDTPEEEEYQDPTGLRNGDVDGQNGITKADALLVIQYLVGLEELTESQIKRADVNRDGVVNALDAAAILRLYLG